MAVEVSIFSQIGEYLVERPRPLIGAETIQIIMIREILDYTVLRTEESRELNAVHTPLSESKRQEVVKRVAFLGGKQKAAESRQLESMLRTAVTDAKMDNIEECYLKDNLCLKCPRCGLFGATALSDKANIKHRIEYSTAFSLQPIEHIGEEFTFNAVGELDQKTGQALGSRHVVRPGSLFPSIVTLKSVTKEEFVLAVKTLLTSKAYGAETRTGGDCRNTIVGFVFGWEEIITPLELSMELYDNQDGAGAGFIETLLNEKYRNLAGHPEKILVLPAREVDALVRECAEVSLDVNFLKKVYGDIASYREIQDGKNQSKK